MTELAREYGEGLYALAEEDGIEDGLLTELETLQGPPCPRMCVTRGNITPT